MNSTKFILFSNFLLIALSSSTYYANAATFTITNKCLYTVWAAAIPGGGRRLDRGETWTLNVPAGTTQGRIWPRTGCSFNGTGHGSCRTGDCSGLLACQGYGQPPNTLAEFALNQFNDLDFFDISLVDGFNVPIEFSPISEGCIWGINCIADINDMCPNTLRAPGGCNNPCTVFGTAPGNCGPTDYSKFFKKHCPYAYSYPQDDETSTFNCPGGTDYSIVFCPV